MIPSPVAELPPRSLAWAAGRLVAIGAAYFVAAMVGLAFRSEPERLAAFWPPSGLLLGLLLVCRPGDRWATAGAGAVACLLANLAGGNSLPLSLAFTAVNVPESALAAWALRWVRRGPFAVDGVRDVLAFFAAAFAVPLLFAVPGACLVVFARGAPDLPRTLLGFWLAHALGAVLIAPAILAWAGARRADLRFGSPWRAAEAAALFAGLAAFNLLLFSEDARSERYQLSYPFPVFPFFVWAGLRFGQRGGTAALLLVSLAAVWNTGRGRGPFIEPGVSAAAAVLMCQFFLATLALGGMALAAALVERDRAAAALADSERRHRELVENIREVFWVMTPDRDRVLYVSPQFEEVYGLPCAGLAADPSPLLAVLGPGDGPTDACVRVARTDGAVRWVHARTFPVYDAAGRVLRVVGIASDVTAEQEAHLAQVALIDQLQSALAEIKTLKGMIPVCAWCRCLRDDAGYWRTLEEYLKTQTDASVTHGICPGCLDGMTGELGELAARS